MGEFVQIGVILKAQGVQGELAVQVQPMHIDLLIDLDVVFIINHRNEKVPYFIETAEAVSDEIVLVKLEDINSREQVVELIKQPILVQKEKVAKDLVDDKYVLDFTIVDNSIGDIGMITDIIEMPYQQLAKVIYKDKEVLIPLHDDLITGVDEQSKKIFMDIPKGLIEVY
ncbi:MAG TPA: ribosome maturation factor RimM [Chitinophagales bacterium]|nr:ribosome maturation factor RimM [Chitinophagales bacterium]